MRTFLSRRHLRAFTLIELLVVIAIIAILIGLLLPAVQKVREAAARMQCTNNLKQMALAIHSHNDSKGKLPPGNVWWGSNNSYGTGWAIEILPYMEQDNLYKQYNQTVVNENSANLAVVQTSVKTYMCPSDVSANQLQPPDSGNASAIQYRTSSYRGNAGMTNLTTGNGFMDIGGGPPTTSIVPLRGPLHIIGVSGLQPESLVNITDGTSNTLLVGEYTTRTHIRRTSFWAYSYTSYALSSVTGLAGASAYLTNDYDGCVAVANADNCKRAWSSFHTGGMNFALCDGSVRFFSQTTDPVILGYMASISGGEVIPGS